MKMRKITSDSHFGDYEVKEYYVNALSGEVNALLKLLEQGERDVRKLEPHFKAWSDVARRAKIEQVALDGAEGENLKNELFQSYRFLLTVLGLYDSVIQELMKRAGTEKFHKQMQARIVKLM